MKRLAFRSAEGQPRLIIALSPAAAVIRLVVSSGGFALEQNGHDRRNIDDEAADSFQRLTPVNAGLAQIVSGALRRLLTHNPLTR